MNLQTALKPLTHATLGLLMLTATLLPALPANAAEQRPIGEVSTDAMLPDTQPSFNAGDDHMAFAWWLPVEFWKASLTRDTSIPQAAKESLYKAYEGVSVLAIAQADIDNAGAFTFYSKDRIQSRLKLRFTAADGSFHLLTPIQKINPELQSVLDAITPMLTAAMGNLGTNLQFFVLPDTSEKFPRLMDPYAKGSLNIDVVRNPNTVTSTTINMPLNSLFVPRLCPNGQPAHISWKFCPWTGQKLPD